MNKMSYHQVKSFLEKVNNDFPVPLSQKRDLSDLAEKYIRSGTFFSECKNGEIVSLVVGYTENLINNIAYISLVATLKKYRGKGYASRLIGDFIAICKEKGIDAVHLYTNKQAEVLYRKMGFTDYCISEEPRPNDIHLILRWR